MLLVDTCVFNSIRGFQVDFYGPNIDGRDKLHEIDPAPIVIVLNNEKEFSKLGLFLNKNKRYIISDYAKVVNPKLLYRKCSYFRAGRGWVNVTEHTSRRIRG